MTQPFVGQIQPFGFGFAPRGWALCNGQLLSISQNTALFSLLGTTYGGNGTSNFALPNLQSSVPIHYGSGPGLSDYVIGEIGGAETVTLLQSEMPAHSHSFFGTSDAGIYSKPQAGGALGQTTGPGSVSPGDNYYSSDQSTRTPINPGTLSVYGGSLPHTNIQPYLTINFCIALQGIYPSRN